MDEMHMTEDKVNETESTVNIDNEVNKAEFKQEVKDEIKQEIKHEIRNKNAGKKGVNRWIYILLALFFGLWGFHRFYAGHALAGVCYLVAFGIGTLLTFIGVGVILLGIEGLVCLYDCVRALMADTDENGLIYV